MDVLLKAFLGIIGGIGILGLIVLFIVFFPEKVKLIQASITQLIGKCSFWARRSTIKNHIEGHCDSAIKEFHKEIPDVDIPKLVVEWVDENNVDTIVKDNEAIVLLQFSRNETLNIVKATTAYVKDAFLVHTKPYLSPSFHNSLDLSVIRYVLQRVRKNSKSTVSRFVNEHAEELHKNSATINKIEKVNDAGLFTRLLIRELDVYGNTLLGRIPEEEHYKEADDFLEFLYQIATREPDEYTKLAFVRPDIKVGVLLVAKIDNFQTYGIRPYLNRIKKGFALGVNTFYLLAREDRINILDMVYKGLLLTGNFTLIKAPKVFEDRQGREAKCYCISVNKASALTNAYVGINQALSTGEELETIVTHIRNDRITLDYNGVKGFVFKQNISSQDITNPLDYYLVGATVFAKPIEINGEGDVEFSLSGTKSDPVSIFSTYKIGMEIDATISYVDDTFVKFTIPNQKTTAIAFREDLTYSRFLLLHKRFIIGTTIRMKIKEMELYKNNLILKLPNLQNPWDDINLKRGDKVTVEICKRDERALVGEIEEGITAVLMHRELSWEEQEQSRVLRSIKLNDKIDCIVAQIDLENKAIYVSLRLLHENPYYAFIRKNAGMEIKATIDSSDEFGVYGHIGELSLFIPKSETCRGKMHYRYAKGKITRVQVKKLSDREDSIIGSFLPFIPSPLEPFSQDYKEGDSIDGIKLVKKEVKYLVFNKKHKGVNYELSLPFYEIASTGYVDDLTTLYSNIDYLPLVIGEINKERNKIYLSLKSNTLRAEDKVVFFDYGKEYEAIVLSRIKNGYMVLILNCWIEVLLNSTNKHNTGDKMTIIPERLSTPISFIEAN